MKSDTLVAREESDDNVVDVQESPVAEEELSVAVPATSESPYSAAELAVLEGANGIRGGHVLLRHRPTH